MRGQCLLRDIDEHRVKKRSFAFTVGYIYCFRTYLLYLSFRHGVLILYRRATFLLRGRRGRSRAAHGFNFAVKVRHRRCHRSPIQPLSQNLRFCQLPFNKERSSVIYRGKGGEAACVWCKASNTECLCGKAAQTSCLRYTGEPRMRSVRLSSFSKYVCGRRPLFGFIHYAARRILRAEIILQIRRHKSGYAESLRRINALHIPAGDFSRRGSRVAGGKNAFHRLASPKEHHFAPFPCSIRE